MIFTFDNFSCDIDVYKNNTDIIVKFYDKSRKQTEGQMTNLVIVDPGFGYINLNMIGNNGIMSGFLDENIFTSNEMIESAIDFVEQLSPQIRNAYIPHHICKVKFTGYVEYNGEY